jgi:hypothetical protein
VGLSGVHRLATTIDARILIAQFQYLGIVSVGPLWYLFCRSYARRGPASPAANLALWVVPGLTILAVATNGEHHQYWREVVPVSADPRDGVTYLYPCFMSGGLLIFVGTGTAHRQAARGSSQYRRGRCDGGGLHGALFANALLARSRPT